MLLGSVTLIGLAIGLGFAISPSEAGGPIDFLIDRTRATMTLLEAAPPWIFFSVMALACLLPIPISAFYMAAGPVYGVGASLAWISVALAINIWLAHLATSGLLRPFVVGVLERRGYALPVTSNPSSLIVMVRLTPGLPWFAQNLMLGLARVDRVPHLVISLPIQMAFATGFVLLGESAFEGRLGAAAAALGVIVVASFAARHLHRRLRVEAAASPH